MTDRQLSRREGNASAERLERRVAIAPPVDIYENADEILVVADMPGAHFDSVNVRLEKEQLFLHARCYEQTEGETLLAGARNADYERTFLVPRGIDAEKIAASLRDGVLEIHLPKSQSVKPRRIEVRGN